MLETLCGLQNLKLFALANPRVGFSTQKTLGISMSLHIGGQYAS